MPSAVTTANVIKFVVNGDVVNGPGLGVNASGLGVDVFGVGVNASGVGVDASGVGVGAFGVGVGDSITAKPVRYWGWGYCFRC